MLDWVKNKVDVHYYFRHFKGSFKGESLDSDLPSPRVFRNHPSCEPFTEFISHSIKQRLAMGAISVWGRLGECEPPHLVMPLTVEPTKPRLCNDNRFFNSWMQDRPFSLDHLYQLPLYVDEDAYQTVCDDKSGYDHILLTDSSRTYFGFEWGGWFSLVTQFLLGGNCRHLCITPRACLSAIFSVPLASLVLFTLMTATLHKFVCLHHPDLRYHSDVETSLTWLVQE